MGKRYVELGRNEGKLIQDWYSCARCWNPVRVCHDKNGDYITCGEDNDCRCEGLIRTSSIKYMIERNEMLAKEAMEVLQIHFEWMRPKKRERLPVGKNLEQLGF